MGDDGEYRKAMEIGSYEEAMEASAHIQTALGHSVAAENLALTSKLAHIWWELGSWIDDMEHAVNRHDQTLKGKLP